jgi:hypothetical protein
MRRCASRIGVRCLASRGRLLALDIDRRGRRDASVDRSSAGQAVKEKRNAEVNGERCEAVLVHCYGEPIAMCREDRESRHTPSKSKLDSRSAFITRYCLAKLTS